jgi:hypothetical protein
MLPLLLLLAYLVPALSNHFLVDIAHDINRATLQDVERLQSNGSDDRDEMEDAALADVE